MDDEREEQVAFCSLASCVLCCVQCMVARKQIVVMRLSVAARLLKIFQRATRRTPNVELLFFERKKEQKEDGARERYARL